MTSLRLLFVLPSFVVAAACNSSDQGACSGAATLDNCNAQIFVPSCAHFSVCHNADGHMGGLDLQTDPRSALVGVATQCMPNCGGMTGNQQTAVRADYPLRVKPGDPDHSFLWLKVSMPNGTDPKYGDRMPASNNPPLDDSCKSLLRTWITNLAADGGP
jgi:hypothetical protein